MKRNLAPIVLGALCLLTTACSQRPTDAEAADAAAAPVGEKGDEELDKRAYEDLKCGGSMYAGTVVSVTVEGTSKTDGQPWEWGNIRFRVTRTIAGPPQKEMTLPFCWAGPDPLAVASDWANEWVPWPARPRRGERLLLLLADETLAARVYNKRVAPVFFRWAAQPDGPLADGFALAARFLAATDEANRDELFRQLCESPLRNMRRFACSASFTYVGWWKGASQVIPFGRGYDPLVQSHLALLYLKHAAPRLNREERIDVTVEFAWWLQMVDLEELPDELKEAFEAWHLKELSVRDDMRQPKAVLEALQRMQKARGAATTLGLFKKSGRADLLGRVQECARSGDPEVEKLARELLTRLDAPEAKGP